MFSNGTSDVYITNADGTGLRRLTTNRADDFDPSLSPDGSMVAFRSKRDGGNEVYAMRDDGSGQHDVSNDPADDWGLAWSPDGRYLVFSPGLNVLHPDGSGLVEIPSPGAGEPEFADWGW